MKRQLVLVLAIAILCFALSYVRADMVFNDGGVHNINYIINDNVQVDYQSWGMETTVNLLVGGAIKGWLQAYGNSQINVYGGSVDQMLQAINHSQLNISGGSIGYLGFSGDSHGDVSGGSIGSLDTAGTSSLYFSGGTIAREFTANSSSQVYFSGGSIGRDLYLFQRSHVNVSGGLIDGDLITENDSVLTIEGSGFAVDGQAVGYGELTSIYGSYWGDEPLRYLTGILASGEPFDNDFYIGNDAKIVLTPLPSAVVLGSIGITFSGWLLRRRGML